MSLHLIESRKLPTATSRKRDGVLVSVSVHALLIVGAFSVAAAAPVANVVKRPNTVVYVAPVKPPPAVTRTVSAPTGTLQQSINHALTVEIPTISVDLHGVISDNFNGPLPAFSQSSLDAQHGALNGAGPGSGYGISPGTGILGEAQVDRPVSVLSGYRTPRYPESQRALGVEQTLNVEFVVDTLGRIEAGSLAFRSDAHPSFQNAVREALANAKFRPAEAGGFRVRQRVAQAFVFSLSK